MPGTHVFNPFIPQPTTSAAPPPPKAYTSAVQDGDLLWCFAWVNSPTTTVTGVIDNLNNIGWTQAFGPIRGATGNFNATLYGFWLPNSAAGTPTVTVSTSANTQGGFVLGAVRNLEGGGTIDAPATTAGLLTGASSNGYQLTSAALAQSGEAAVAFILAGVGPTVPLWTAAGNVDSVNFERGQLTITANAAAQTVGTTGGSTSGTATLGAMFFRDLNIGDSTPPTMTGTVTVTPGSTTASAVCPTASDNVAVTAYEASIDGGTTWPFTSSTPTISITGLTPSTAYTGRFRAKDAAGNVSTPVLTQAFTTTAGSDTTVPTMTGTVTVTPGSTTASALCPTASDNVGVTAYEASIDGGTTWPFTSATPTISITGLTPSTAYTGRFRAKDAAGNVSTPVLTQAFTTTAASNPTVTVPALAAWTGTVQGTLTVPNVVIVRRSDRVQVLALTNVVTDINGNLVISNAALSTGVGYMVLGFTNDGVSSFRRAVTAV